MPRSNGTYTLPLGSIVQTGQDILPSQHNSPLEDIAAALTQSLPRDGSAGMTGPFKAQDGSALSPSIAFSGSPGTGLFKTPNGIGISVGGAQATEITAAGFIVGDKTVTNAKLADMATARIKGRVTAGSGAPEDLTGTQVTTLLDPVVGDNGTVVGTKGLVPATAIGDAAAGRFLAATGLWAVPPPSVLVQRAYAEYTAWAGIAALIPLDDTKPQNNEGTQILSASITPKAATNRIRIRFAMWGASTNAAMAALFRDSGPDAIQSVVSELSSYGLMAFEFEEAAGSTATRTYSVRVGSNNGTLVTNGNSITRLMGGSARSTLIIEEMLP